MLGSDGMGLRESEAWTVEKRFRVTEVFLAILWVRAARSVPGRLTRESWSDAIEPLTDIGSYSSVPRQRTSRTFLPIASCQDG